jgi:hypothetical protein
MWINLSSGLYFFGDGGITRVEDCVHYKSDGSKTAAQSSLYAGKICIVSVEETLEQIKKILDEDRVAY